MNEYERRVDVLCEIFRAMGYEVRKIIRRNLGGFQLIVTLDEHNTFSVVCGEVISMGSSLESMFEVAHFDGDKRFIPLDGDTDVVGHLNMDQVVSIFKRIEEELIGDMFASYPLKSKTVVAPQELYSSILEE